MNPLFFWPHHLASCLSHKIITHPLRFLLAWLFWEPLSHSNTDAYRLYWHTTNHKIMFVSIHTVCYYKNKFIIIVRKSHNDYKFIFVLLYIQIVYSSSPYQYSKRYKGIRGRRKVEKATSTTLFFQRLLPFPT